MDGEFLQEISQLFVECYDVAIVCRSHLLKVSYDVADNDTERLPQNDHSHGGR